MLSQTPRHESPYLRHQPGLGMSSFLHQTRQADYSSQNYQIYDQIYKYQIIILKIDVTWLMCNIVRNNLMPLISIYLFFQEYFSLE